MGIFSGLFRSRDKPKDSYDSPSYSYFFGRTHAGKRVNDRTAMQIIAVYACVSVLSEAIAQLPLHVYQYTDKGKERVPMHPLYFLLHDQPNPEMTSFVFRETLMAHLMIYGNAYAQIISAMAAFWSIREKYDRLEAVFGILKDDNHSIIETVKEIEKAYNEFCNEGCYEYSNAAKQLDRLCNALPDRAWIM